MSGGGNTEVVVVVVTSGQNVPGSLMCALLWSCPSSQPERWSSPLIALTTQYASNKCLSPLLS